MPDGNSEPHLTSRRPYAFYTRFAPPQFQLRQQAGLDETRAIATMIYFRWVTHARASQSGGLAITT